jgi:hypothetical protein
MVAVGFVGPRWYEGNRTALTAKANAHYLAAATWIDGNLEPRDTQIVVDDALWLDMVEVGFRPQAEVVWFYKLDLDSAVRTQFPGGWREMEYVVSTPIIRQNRSTLPTVDTLLTRSTVVVTFGTGEDRVEIRHVRQEEP